MIYRIYPSKDAFITNAYLLPFSTRNTGSNTGQSEELQVFKSPPISGAIGSLGSSSLGRALLQFDLSQLAALTASGDIPASGMTFWLRLNHKSHGSTQPSGYDLVIAPVSAAWDEGVGFDVKGLGDAGCVNWVKRTASSYWSTPGGDFLTSPTSSVHLDTGYEDVEVDVTSLVNGWLAGTVPNNGIGVMMSADVESDANFGNFYVKKLYSRQTDFVDRVPYIEVRSGDAQRDDRANMTWSRSGTLYLYNIVGGAYQDLPAGAVYVDVQDSSGTLLSLTASHGAVGVYSASFALPTGSYSGSVFYDKWGSGSFAFSTGTFTFLQAGPSQTISQAPLTARARNLQYEYLPEDVAVLEVFFRRRAHTYPVVQTASLGSAPPYIVEDAYYAVENDATRERVIPFGTGSQQHTRLSYNSSGNYFKLFMSSLHSGNVYRVIFLVTEQGRRQVIDPGIRFKVV